MDILDDLIKTFDLNPKMLEPDTSEDIFMTMMTEGKHEKVYNLRFHLNRELSFFDFVCKSGSHPRKEVLDQGRIIYKQLTTLEYSKLVIEYAIHSQFAGTLAVASDRGGKACNIQTLVDRLCEHDGIKNVINNTFFLR